MWTGKGRHEDFLADGKVGVDAETEGGATTTSCCSRTVTWLATSLCGPARAAPTSSVQTVQAEQGPTNLGPPYSHNIAI